MKEYSVIALAIFMLLPTAVIGVVFGDLLKEYHISSLYFLTGLFIFYIASTLLAILAIDVSEKNKTKS